MCVTQSRDRVRPSVHVKKPCWRSFWRRAFKKNARVKTLFQVGSYLYPGSTVRQTRCLRTIFRRSMPLSWRACWRALLQKPRNFTKLWLTSWRQKYAKSRRRMRTSEQNAASLRTRKANRAVIKEKNSLFLGKATTSRNATQPCSVVSCTAC